MSQTSFARWRQTVDFTQAEAAEALGVDVRTIKDWEAGTRKPSLAVRKTMRAYSVGISLDPWPVEEINPLPKSAEAHSETISHSNRWSSTMGMKDFFEMMGAPLRNYRWSWGARIRGPKESYLLRAWRDEVLTSNDERIVGLYHPHVYRELNYNSPGIGERHAQLLAIRNGKQGWCVLCEAMDTRAIPRKIAGFQDVVYPIIRIVDGENGIMNGVLGLPISRAKFLSLSAAGA